MTDLEVDKKKPWAGPGKDPRADQFMDEEVEQENPDDDDGDETFLDPSTSLSNDRITRADITSFSTYGEAVY